MNILEAIDLIDYNIIHFNFSINMLNSDYDELSDFFNKKVKVVKLDSNNLPIIEFVENYSNQDNDRFELLATNCNR